MIGEGMAVAGVFPAIAVDLVGPAYATSRQHDGRCAENPEPAALAIVTQRAGHSLAILEQADNSVLHVHLDALVDSVVLQRADHFEASAVADVRQARIAVTAEIPLEYAAVGGAIEESAPRFEFSNACRSFLGMQLGHAPVVEVLPATHRIGEVNSPVIPVVDVGKGGGDAAFGHYGVGFAEQRLTDHSYGCAGRCSFDGGAQTGAAGAYNQHVVIVSLVLGHQRILQSVNIPIEQSLTYRSANATEKRFIQAHRM